MEQQTSAATGILILRRPRTSTIPRNVNHIHSLATYSYTLPRLPFLSPAVLLHKLSSIKYSYGTLGSGHPPDSPESCILGTMFLADRNLSYPI